MADNTSLEKPSGPDWDSGTGQGKLRDEIVELKDTNGRGVLNTDNDRIEQESLNKILTLDVRDFLVKHLDVVKKLIDVVDQYKDFYFRNSGVEEVYNFLKAIVEHKPFVVGSSSEVQQAVDDESGGNPIDMDGINNKIGNYGDMIDGLIGNLNISVDVKPTLYNIKKVLDNPSNKSYVKQLQEYLYNRVYKNLSDSEKSGFVSANGGLQGDNFQGNGDISELLESKALDVILGRIENSQNSLNVGGVVYQREQSSSIKVIAGSSSSLTDVNLYNVSSGPSYDDNESGGQAQTLELPEINSLRTALHVERGETMYFMKVGDKTYAVKLDSQKYLSPIAVDVTQGLTETVYFKNNPSCIGYLRNKIPSNVGNYLQGVDIIWDGSDYAIGVPGTKMLTIEPMTLNGTWISDNLGECLSMLCFVNYLRNSKGIDGYEFDNDNPDLSWKDGENSDAGKLLVAIKKSDDKEKRKMAKEQSGSKHKAVVDLKRFGLDFLSSKDKSEVRRKFLKYNNGEDWEDNWDKKKENKSITNRVDLSEELAKNEYKAPAAPAQAPGGGNGGSRGGGSGVEAHSDYIHSLGSNWQKADQYGIKKSGAPYPEVYQYSGREETPDLCYQEGNSIVRISHESYWIRQTGTGTIDSSGLQNFTQTKEELNVCEKGADQLTKSLESVWGSMFGGGVKKPSDLKILASGDDYNLTWSVDNNKTISLKNVLMLDEFCGIKKGDENFVEKRLKVALLAYVHYNQIESSKHLTITAAECENFGVNKDNKEVFFSWVKQLSSSNKLDSLVFLPSVNEIKAMGSFDGKGKFTFNHSVEQTDGKGKKYIEINDNKYYKDATEGLVYELGRDKNYVYVGDYVSKDAHGYGTVVTKDFSYQGYWLNNDYHKGIGYVNDNKWVENYDSNS